MKKIAILGSILTLSLFHLGCASSGATSGTNKAAKKNALKSKDVQVTALRSDKKNFGRCPRGNKSWKRQNMKALIKSANACTKAKKWKQLGKS